jgi:hypothetical protein
MEDIRMMYIIDFFGQINFSGKVKEERIYVPQFVNWTKLEEKRDPAMQRITSAMPRFYTKPTS